MRGCIVLSTFAVGLTAAAAASQIHDHSSMLFLRDLHYPPLDDLLQSRDVDDYFMILLPRGRKGKGKPPQPSGSSATGSAAAASRSAANPGQSGAPSPGPQAGAGPRPGGRTVARERGDRASQSATQASQSQGRQITQTNPGRVRSMPDSGAVLASSSSSSPDSTGSRAPSLNIGGNAPASPGTRLANMKLSSPAMSGPASSASSTVSGKSRTRSPSPNKPSTSGRNEEASRSLSPPTRAASPASSPPRSSNPISKNVSTRIVSSTEQGPSAGTAIKAGGFNLRPLEKHAPYFNEWFADGKVEVDNAKMNRAIQAPRHPTFGPSRASQRIAAEEKKEAAAKRTNAKELRKVANKDYKDAAEMRARYRDGSPAANAAFTKSSRSANRAVMAGKASADAHEAVADELVSKQHWEEVPKYLQRASRAFQRSILRNGQTKAFQDGYTASLAKDLAMKIRPDDPDRSAAFGNAAGLRKGQIDSVHEYRERYQQYQKVRQEFSGSSSDESEKSFSDVQRI